MTGRLPTGIGICGDASERADVSRTMLGVQTGYYEETAI